MNNSVNNKRGVIGTNLSVGLKRNGRISASGITVTGRVGSLHTRLRGIGKTLLGITSKEPLSSVSVSGVRLFPSIPRGR